MKKNTLFMQDIITADQFSRQDIDFILYVAKKMERIVKKSGSTTMLKGNMMAALFYEPSSRTFGSFVAAMQRLGGMVVPVLGMNNSSVAKGETLPDTMRAFASYCDVIVLRHPEVGSAKLAAEFSDPPVINAGDGIDEHPTQALLDFYTICNHFSGIKGLTVSIVGDLLNGRTVHSLCHLLSLYPGAIINLISPQMLSLPKSSIAQLTKRGVTTHEMEKLDEVIGKTDILYVTRVQKERFSDLKLYEKLKHYYVISSPVVKRMKKTAIIMHPLPRVGEITTDVDIDSRAVYMREQMRNGLYVRMAVLALILKKEV